MQPWDCQPKEGAEAYEAFAAYLALGAERSQEAVSKELSKSRQLLGRWASKFDWVERAKAYDAHMAAIAQAAREQVLAEEAATWARRQVEAREKEWTTSRALFLKAMEILTHPLTRQTIEEDEEETEDGTIIRRTTIIEPVRFAPADAARLADIASKLARLTTEMPTERRHVEIDYTTLTDEQIDQLIAGEPLEKVLAA